jgi:biopolymer transport protein ExbD
MAPLRNPFRRRRHGMDLTPLIDCIFLILIFFMMTSSFIKKDLFKVLIPKVSKAERAQNIKEVVDLYIDEYGGYRVGADVATIVPKERLREKLQPYRHLPVIFKVDRRAPSEFLAYGIGVLFEMQMDKFSIQVQQSSGR